MDTNKDNFLAELTGSQFLLKALIDHYCKEMSIITGRPPDQLLAEIKLLARQKIDEFQADRNTDQ